MNKLLIYISLFCITITLSKNVYAFRITNNVSGKLYLNVGYTYQFYSSFLKDIQNNSTNYVENPFTGVFINEKMNNKQSHVITGGIGLDIFRKIGSNVESFIGLHADAKIPIQGDVFNKNNILITNDDKRHYVQGSVQYVDFLNVTAQIGFSFKVSKHFKIAPYAFGGIAVALYNTMDYEYYYKKITPQMMIGRKYIKAYEDLNATLQKLSSVGINITLEDFCKNGYQYFLLHNIKTTVYEKADHDLAQQYATDKGIDHYYGSGPDPAGVFNWSLLEKNIVIENEENAKLLFEESQIYQIYGYAKGQQIIKASRVLLSDGITLLNKEEKEKYDNNFGDFKQDNQIKVGFVAGGGINFVIHEKFSITPEYRYIEIQIEKQKIQAHNIAIKFGLFLL